MWCTHTLNRGKGKDAALRKIRFLLLSWKKNSIAWSLIWFLFSFWFRSISSQHELNLAVAVFCPFEDILSISSVHTLADLVDFLLCSDFMYTCCTILAKSVYIKMAHFFGSKTFFATFSRICMHDVNSAGCPTPH